MATLVEMVAQQNELIKKFQEMERNFKKDSASRKTYSYLMQRIANLEAYWQQYENNEAVILASDASKDLDYVKNNVYASAKRIYVHFKNILLNYTPENPEGDGPGKEEEKKWKECNKEIQSGIKAFQRTITGFNIEQLNEKWHLEDELKTISMRWANVDKLYWKIDNMPYNNSELESEYNALETQYKKIKADINKKIWEGVHQEQSTPKIELPYFNGNYETWITFKDLFLETVHKNSLISNAQKMKHLKAKLKGEAERLVQHLQISSDNYETCWEMLTARYDNIRLLFSHYANALLNQPMLNHPTGTQIKSLHDTSRECMNAISNLKIDTNSWDPLIVHILVQKLGTELADKYMESLKSTRELPTFDEFLQFLENKFTAKESTQSSQQGMQRNSQPSGSANKPYNRSNNRQNVQSSSKNKICFTATTKVCPKCEQDHRLYQCKAFLEMTPDARLKIVENLHVCSTCLVPHNGRECRSKFKCKYCKNGHNYLLHDAIVKSENSHSNNEQNQRHNIHVSNDDLSEVLLATVKIRVQSADGSYITLRALLDQGSQITLITENAAQQLKLKRNRYNAVVTGLGAVTANKCKGEVEIKCQSIHTDFKINAKALIMNTLTNKLPNSSFSKDGLNHIEHLKLADPQFNISQEIDMILGADIYSDLILEGLVRVNNNNIIAQQTRLGWVVCGKIKSYKCHVVTNNIDQVIKFWEQEEISDSQTEIDPNEKCEMYYKETTIRLPDGRYQVRLPMKLDYATKLGASKPQAVAILKQMEQRMKRVENLAVKYREFMKEYEDMGHMKKSNRMSNSGYFMPHHGIVRPHAVTTKLRVVFNASAASKSGLSLNDLMEGGPNLQADLQTLLLKWRQHKYVFTADIEKMYRFISIHPDDQTLQKIVWRHNPREPLSEYQLTTITYGTKAAPFLAQRTLKQLASDEGGQFPIAEPILKNNFYMDDVLFGKPTKEEAREARDQLVNLLRAGGLNLRKWSSNEESLVKDLPNDMRSPCNFNFTESETSKTLGLGWNPKTDNFVFTSPFDTEKKIKTKRDLLSDIAKIFDPLGWLSPITIKTKLLFQKVWLSKITWDQELPDDIGKEWHKIREDMANIERIKVQRGLGFDDPNIEVELHAFSDASEKAYSAVVYCTVRSSTGKARVSIIGAKTKVAPIKSKITLPRLELNGALLAAKLLQKVKDAYSTVQFKIHAWTDSMVVMGWLQGDVNRWQSFVANRVKSIKQIIPADAWQYVKSEENPADCASRGILPSQLLKHSLWWEGPEWLKNKINFTPKIFETKVEIKAQILVVQNPEPTLINKLLKDHSDINKAVRILSWVLRFKTNARGATAERVTSNYVSVPEMRHALLLITKQSQLDLFQLEINELNTKQRVGKSSKLLKLNPYMDKKGLLRVGGRLKNSELKNDAKFPIILAKNNRLTELLIEQAHKTTLHGGVRLTLNHLRQKYWIVSGTGTVKTILRKCVKCARYSAPKQTQMMGDLPEKRVTPSKPFYNCGVDYAGPFDIKANKGRGIKTTKGYVAVFVCMATKAVHIELASDMSSQTFLTALRRMIARRGVPKNMYSDNGTNFVGANRELKKLFKEHSTFYDSVFQKATTDLQIMWHFNAPSWPTAGGLWEAAVKSMKYHLKRVLGEQKLTFEEFSTLLSQVEACMNSRPLVPLTEDKDDLEFVLTPGHFLIGEPLTTLPEDDYTEQISLRNRWQLTTKLYQDFWKKWSTEYLQSLQSRSKWNNKQPNLKNGDVVVIKEDNLPPSRWALGRVQETHPGKDDLVRVVTLKTKHGVMKRPVTKLVTLPTERSEPKEPKQVNVITNKRTMYQKFVVFTCLMLMLISGSSGTPLVNVNPFETERQIYYDEIGKLETVHDNWKVVTYFNLSTYWQGMSKIGSYVDYVENLCSRCGHTTLCKGVVTELRQEIDDLNHNNYLLRAHYFIYSNRTKRGLFNGVGQLAHSLFGVLDDRFAEQYKNDIEMVKINENHLLQLLKNQTSIIESQNNIMKRNEEAMNTQFQLIEKHIQELGSTIAQLQSRAGSIIEMTYFNAVALSANMIISKLRRLQDSIIDVFNNVHKGVIDSTLISQEQILEQLGNIAAQLPPNLSLPVEDIYNDLADVFKLMHVKSRVTDNYFILEVKIPLINDNQFRLYKVIPIPMRRDKELKSIIPQSDYIAINIIKDIYVKLSENDLQTCVVLKDSKYVCTVNNPIHSMRQQSVPCEIAFITNNKNPKCYYRTEECKNEWIKLHSYNTWMYVCCGDCLLRVMCQHQMMSKEVNNVGTITVGQGCTIKEDETTIYTDTIYQNKLYVGQNLMIPTINDLNNITKLTPTSRIEEMNTYHRPENHAQLVDIEKRISELKQISEMPKQMSVHDTHQYVISYSTLVGVLLLGVVFAVITRIRRKRKARRRSPRDPRDVALEEACARTAALLVAPRYPQRASALEARMSPQKDTALGERIDAAPVAIGPEASAARATGLSNDNLDAILPPKPPRLT